MNNPAILVIGLTLGDEGKGGVTDLVCETTGAELNIRFAADPQSAHYIVREDGDVATFGQIGSALTNPPVRCHLGHETLVRASSLMVEIDALAKKQIHVRDRLTIDPDTMLVLPWHGMIDRMLELARGDGRHGTSGIGSEPAGRDRGLPSSDAPRFGDIFDFGSFGSKLQKSFDRARREAETVVQRSGGVAVRDVFADYLDRCPVHLVHRDLDRIAERLDSNRLRDSAVGSFVRNGPIVLEGTQGMLLNPRVGFRPHVSSCDSSKENAKAFLARAGHTGSLRTIGVLRAYATRFGPGPLVTSDPVLAAELPELHNEASPWHGEFRAGPLDLVSTRYAIRAAGGVDLLAVNHLDRVGARAMVQVCTAYEYLGPSSPELERNFVLEGDGSKLLVTDIRIDCNPEEVTKTLLHMKPARLETFDGWGAWTPKASTTPPRSLEAFLDLLADPTGLGVPIGITSFGPRRSDKRILRAL